MQLLYAFGGSKVLQFNWLMYHKWNVIEQYFRSYCTQLDAVFFLMAIMQYFKHVFVDISQNRAVYAGTHFCSCSSPSVGHWRRVLHTAFHVYISFFVVHLAMHTKN